MITAEIFTEMALSFPGTTHQPHFDRKGFKVVGKRMFATYLPTNNTANIFLTPVEQAVFCKMDKVNIYPVPNKWGHNGATTFELNSVAKQLVREALLSAYTEVVRKKSEGLIPGRRCRVNGINPLFPGDRGFFYIMSLMPVTIRKVGHSPGFHPAHFSLNRRHSKSIPSGYWSVCTESDGPRFFENPICNKG